MVPEDRVRVAIDVADVAAIEVVQRRDRARA
jgi:hypothetical protein